MKSYFEHKGENFTLDLTPLGEGYQVNFGEKSAEVHFARGADGQVTFILDGRKIETHVSADGKRRWVSFGGETWMLEKTSGVARGAGGGIASGRLLAPMPGQVRAVNVSAGEAVEKGQTLLVLEAMKMEIRIQAPMDGVVGRLVVTEEQTVEREELLVEVDEGGSGE
jgi:acetyl/propionyl-CoA carboxylase alpha subunit